jgi:hypothetical protein
MTNNKNYYSDTIPFVVPPSGGVSVRFTERANPAGISDASKDAKKHPLKGELRAGVIN